MKYDDSRIVSRRSILGGSLGASASALFFTPAATAKPGVYGWVGSRSANGWRIGAPSSVFGIEGTNVSVTLASGAPAVVLLHAARRINYELDTLRKGDIVGVSFDRLQVKSPEQSNLLSGTAIHFRPGSFPRGESGNLFPHEIVVLEDIVAESAGVLSWGGHLAVPDQGLIYVSRGPEPTGSVARRVESLDRIDSSEGAGAVDSHHPKRRQAALKARRKRL